MRMMFLPCALVLCLIGSAAGSQGGSDVDAPIETRVEECTKAIERPETEVEDLADAYVTRGLAYAAGGDLEAANVDLDQAVKTSPENPQIRDLRGQVLFELGEYSSVVVDFNWVIERFPGAYGVLLYRCSTRSEIGDHWGAIDDCENALRIEPNLAEAYRRQPLRTVDIA